MPELNELMGPTEATKTLCVTQTTLRVWAFTGRYGLRYVRDSVGRMWFYREDITRIAKEYVPQRKLVSAAAAAEAR